MTDNSLQEQLDQALGQLSENIAGLQQKLEAANQLRGLVDRFGSALQVQEKNLAGVKELQSAISTEQHALQERLAHLEAFNHRAQKVQKTWLMALTVFTGLLFVSTIGGFMVHFFSQPTHNKRSEALLSPAENRDQSLSGVQNATVPGPNSPAQEVILPDAAITNLSQAEQTIIKTRAGYALTYLKRKNFERLGEKYFHPEKGVHFYPYGLKANGQAFTSKNAGTLLQISGTQDWGVVQSGGSPIKMSFDEYYRNYVYDQDYSSTNSVLVNEISFAGNTGLSGRAIAGKYPDCAFVEYQANGKSLVLVFERFGGPNMWYLVGVIHNE